MKPILLYLLQVIISSGLLYGYYHLFLRNKRFHQYNRYYLLAATVISIFVPFLNIPVYFSQHDEPAVWLQTISGVSSDDVPVIASTGAKQAASFSWQQALTLLYILAGVLILIRFIIAIIRIRAMLRKYEVEQLGSIYFVNTEEPGTPFSFFRWMFWNNKIKLQSDNGQQIFRHELFHIKQKHSWDTVFIELLTMVFWINPFFHLIKKELKAIHEFLADQFAIKENDQWNYAELLLMHLMGTPNLRLTHPFFHNQIKRRIAMITSSQKPKYQYFRKVLVLPLLALIAVLFAFTYRQKQEKEQEPKQKPALEEIVLTESHPLIREMFLADTPRKKSNEDVITLVANSIIIRHDGKNGSKQPKADLYIVDSKHYTREQFEEIFKEVTFSGKVIITPANNSDAIKIHGPKAKNGVVEIVRGSGEVEELEEVVIDKEKPIIVKEVKEKEELIPGIRIVSANELKEKPLYVINGKVIPEKSDFLKELTPFEIEFMNVLKDKSAIEKYGKDGANGVIEIFTKLKETLKEESEVNTEEELKEVVVTGRPIRAEEEPTFPGGAEGFRKFLERNLKPNTPVDNNAPPGTYTVSVRFVVDAEGNVSDIKPLTLHGYGMEAEVVRVIQQGPKWTPAKVSGKKIKAYKTQRITFMVVGEDKSDDGVVVVGYPGNAREPLRKDEKVVVGEKIAYKEPLKIDEKINMPQAKTPATINVKDHEHLSPIYPNPATSNVSIPYNTTTTGEGEVWVVDAAGKTVITRKTNLVKGINTINLDVSSLSKGIYFIAIVDGEKKPSRIYKLAKE